MGEEFFEGIDDSMNAERGVIAHKRTCDMGEDCTCDGAPSPFAVYVAGQSADLDRARTVVRELRVRGVAVIDTDGRLRVTPAEAVALFEKVVLDLTAERDRLAAALAEVREAAGAYPGAPVAVAFDRVRDALAALPTDLAATRDARVRAEALREAADRMEAADLTLGSGEDMPAVWLRAEAERIGGGR